MHRLLAPVALCLGLSLPATALAQYMSSFGYSFNNPISSTCNSLMWQHANARAVYRSALERHGYTDAQLEKMSEDDMKAALGGGAKAAAAAKKPRAHGASKFKPQKKRLLLGKMAASLVSDPAQQKVLRDLFEAGIAAYEKEARSSGGVHDVAGAMGFFIATAYSVYHDGAEPNPEGVEMLIRALQAQYDTPEFARVAAADKQRFYELMLGLATYLGATYQQAAAAGDAELAGAMKQTAAGAPRGFLKLDPDTLRFVPTGIEIAR